MRVLMISTDKKIFEENSEARQRIVEYGELVEELHVIIKTQKFPPEAEKFKAQNFRNVFLYPANSKRKWFYIFDAAKIGRKILNTGGQWLISSQDPFECGLVGWLIKKKLGIPLQLQIHTDFLSPYFWKESLLNKIRALIAKFLIPRASCIRVVSERIKNSILVFAKAPTIAVLPIFVDVKKIQETPVKTNLHQKYPQFDFIILMASRLTREKKISLTIEAMKDVVEKHPKAGLIIVGDGPEEKNLKSQISNLKINENIKIEPWTDDLASYYKTADLFLLTSNYEGYGRTIVEAMAVGCPIIMTDVGLAGEIFINKKDGLIIPVANKEKLIEAILKIIENPGLRNDFIENSKKIIKLWPAKELYLERYRNSWLSCKPDFRT